METTVPDSLLGLPEPWNRLDAGPHDSLIPSAETRAAAVDVIARCLQALAELPEVSDDEFPEYITIAWSLWSKVFVDEMPTFDQFHPEPFARWFRQQDPAVSDTLLHRYAIAWIRKQVAILLRTTYDWLFLSIRDAPDREIITALRQALERWWHADQLFSVRVLSNLWTLDRAGSTELLQHIVRAPDASTDMVERLSSLLAREP